MLRKALPARALAIIGSAKYSRRAKTARIVAESGVGKTYMALGTIHVLGERRSSTTLVMCPSHITHKCAREILLTIPHARAFLIEDMRNGGDPQAARHLRGNAEQRQDGLLGQAHTTYGILVEPLSIVFVIPLSICANSLRQLRLLCTIRLTRVRFMRTAE
jgi:hypothetical protein